MVFMTYVLLFGLGLLLFVGGLKFGIDLAGLLGTAIMTFVVLRFRLIAYAKPKPVVIEIKKVDKGG